ncbi:HpcH/HpaI aldolase/citrate lyase family protein [Leucobacter sp. USHLN153]|uniref:HpcH/HpaI aldolase/citrate lyase family protein n=1 Tax=Leucobacter sp. USHLN153 TaxID=3081268 RepID=UPI00301A2241
MTDSSAIAAPAISYLFVPASRPDRFEKALASAADAVIIDLEDAVPQDEKDRALSHLLLALDQGLSRPAHVRMNAADSPWFERDLEALAELTQAARASLAGVVIPKAESATDVARVAHALEGARHGVRDTEIIALIESAVGVSAVREIAEVTGLSRFAVGAADLSFDLDVDLVSSTLDWVYARLVVESRLAGLAGPIASPPFEIQDLSVVEREAVRLRGLGATAQLSIHPAQLQAIHAGFLPAPKKIEWARRVLAAAEVTDGAAQVDGQMVDKPVRERAERILAQVR